MNKKVHVFFGKFDSVEEAILYTEAQWEAEPDDSASDEDYAAWEDRNPVWAMKDDLGIYLDHNFIETISEDLFPYLKTQLAYEADFETVKSIAPADSNMMVLVMVEALGGSEAALNSTPRLTYCGVYDWAPG